MYLPPLTTLVFFAGKSLIWGFGAAGGVFVSFLSAITSPLQVTNTPGWRSADANGGLASDRNL